jgi:hypothetical protein
MIGNSFSLKKFREKLNILKQKLHEEGILVCPKLSLIMFFKPKGIEMEP